MKKLILCLTLLLSLISQAQINVGSNENIIGFKPGEFDPVNLNSLKNSKTLFIYRKSDVADLETFKKAMSDGWKLTPLEFCEYKDYAPRKYKGYSVFNMSGVQKTKTSSSGLVSYVDHYYLLLTMNESGETLTFARIELFLASTSIEGLRKVKDPEKVKYLYDNADIRNWYAGQLKNCLQLVSNTLEKEGNHVLFTNKVFPELGSIKNDTLYIPDYALIDFNKFSGNEDERLDPLKLMADYPYPYKFVSTEEMNALILNSEKPVFYLNYVKSSTNKFLNIINSQTGELLYSVYKGLSYNVNKKDIKKLVNSIK